MAITGIKLRCGPEHWASMAIDKDAFVYQADKILVPKVDGSGLSIAQGEKVYFVSASAAVTGTAGSNTLCGRCLEAAVAGDTTVLIALNGNVEA
jgi:hypothetical protein